jgi:hypothetical protein
MSSVKWGVATQGEMQSGGVSMGGKCAPPNPATITLPNDALCGLSGGAGSKANKCNPKLNCPPGGPLGNAR